MWRKSVTVFGIRFSFHFGRNIEFDARSHFRTTFNDVKLTLNIISNSLFLVCNGSVWLGRAMQHTNRTHIYTHPNTSSIHSSFLCGTTGACQNEKKETKKEKRLQQGNEIAAKTATTGKQQMKIRQAGGRNLNCTTKYYYLNRCIVCNRCASSINKFS